MQTATFDLGLTRVKGEVVSMNAKTIKVRLPQSGKVIKRHFEKHRVKMEGNSEQS